MNLYKRKIELVQVYTFDELVQYAQEHSEAPHWHFEWNGFRFTHESDECYLMTRIGGTWEPKLVTPTDVLVSYPDGFMYPYPKVLFNRAYERFFSAPCPN